MSTLRSLPLRDVPTQPIVGALIAALTLACVCSAQSHLETNYAETDTEGNRLYLFGDPFGIRSALADKGITFNFLKASLMRWGWRTAAFPTNRPPTLESAALSILISTS